MRAEWLQIRFQKPDVATHHAEMGNLLSLYPKIHRLPADTKETGGVPDRQGEFRANGGIKHDWRRYEPGVTVVVLLDEGLGDSCVMVHDRSIGRRKFLPKFRWMIEALTHITG